MASDPRVRRRKSLERTVKAGGKKPPLAALCELAAWGNDDALALLVKRSREDVVLDVLIATVHARSSATLSFHELLAASKHRHVRDRVVAELATAEPDAYNQFAHALVALTPGNLRREADCALLLSHPELAPYPITEFVLAHGTPAQIAKLPGFFDLELRPSQYMNVLKAVPNLDSAALFDRYRTYFLQGGVDRLTAVRNKIQAELPIDLRWLDFCLEIARANDKHPRNTALWLLEDLAKQIGPSFPFEQIKPIARAVTAVIDLDLWCHLFDIMRLAPDTDFATLTVQRLAADLDAYVALETLEALPKRLVATALHEHGLPKLERDCDQERLDAIVAALHVHAPEYANAAPKPELLWQLIRDSDAEGVQRLLAAGISPETPPPENKYTAPTPLFQAIEGLYTKPAEDNLAIVKALVEAGAKTDIQLTDTWDFQDVRFKKRETASTITRKLLAHVTAPYDETILRPIGRYEEDPVCFDKADRKQRRPALRKLAELLA